MWRHTSLYVGVISSFLYGDKFSFNSIFNFFFQKVIHLPHVVSQSDIVLAFFSRWGTDHAGMLRNDIERKWDYFYSSFSSMKFFLTCPYLS